MQIPLHRNIAFLQFPFLTIIKSIALDFNLQFKFIYEEFMQTHEETDGRMTLRSTDKVHVSLISNSQKVVLFQLDY